MVESTRKEPDIGACYYTAAQAVFAIRVCGGGVRYVEADELYCAGRLRIFEGWAESCRRALYLQAGFFARMLKVQGKFPTQSWKEFSDEEETILESLDEEFGGYVCGPMELLREMEEFTPELGTTEEQYWIVVAETKENVRRLWPEITAVAEALQKRRRLEGEEVERLIS